MDKYGKDYLQEEGLHNVESPPSPRVSQTVTTNKLNWRKHTKRHMKQKMTFTSLCVERGLPSGTPKNTGETLARSFIISQPSCMNILQSCFL